METSSPDTSAGAPDMARIVRLAADHGLNLKPASVILDETGWDFRVVHATATDGTRWIVRVPRRPDAARSADVEKRLLTLLHGRLDVAIPEWKIATDEIIAYPRLSGEPAASEDPITFILHWRIHRAAPPAAYVEPLGRLMAMVHTTPVSEAESVGVPSSDQADVRALFAARLERGADLFAMHPTWRARAKRWIDQDEWWSDQTVLIHGDLHPGHTLVDETGALVGVLDWTDARIADPGQEFVEAARKFEPEMLERLVGAYERAGGPAWPGLRAHVKEAIAFAPLDLGLLGVEVDKPRYTDKARAWFGTPTTEAEG